MNQSRSVGVVLRSNSLRILLLVRLLAVEVALVMCENRPLARILRILPPNLMCLAKSILVVKIISKSLAKSLVKPMELFSSPEKIPVSLRTFRRLKRPLPSPGLGDRRENRYDT